MAYAVSNPEAILNLDGFNWIVTNKDQSITVPARVPGEIHSGEQLVLF